MELTKKITLAKAINKLINACISDIWAGFVPVPFILYDDINQVAIGGEWPKRYKNIEQNIWAAEGTDQMLMGNTALMYNNCMIAIWDTRTWSDDIEVSRAAACVAHEMFHAYQQMTLNLPWANELMLPQYRHSPHSIALVIEENKCLADIIANYNPASIRICLEKIAGLRKQRETEIGTDLMEYDQRVEGIEGTAAYIEIRMKAILNNKTPLESVSSYFSKLTQNNNLLNDYRHRCYAAGLILCLAADMLCPDWQTEWVHSGLMLFNWLKEKLSLTQTEVLINQTDLQVASKIVSMYNNDKQSKIAEFTGQSLISLEGEIQLLLFDPMNLVCINNRCLHLHAQIRLGANEYYIQSPFLEEFDGTIMKAKCIWIPNAVTSSNDGNFTIDGLGKFKGYTEQSVNGLRCVITK